MAAKLFIGSLSYTVTEDELKTLFAEVGTVESAKIIMDRDSGRSKGFAFVEMSTDAEAQNAISSLNGKEVGGRSIAVTIAKPMTDRPARPASNFNRGSRY
ncbi:MAG: RNA recognition motif domain-containing protein [Candidatus Saccharimonadia bacterium]